MPLSNQDLVELVAFRRQLHENPEISNEEKDTARSVVSFLAATGPDEVLTGLGGHGVAAIYDSGAEGPTVLLRAELDALPANRTVRLMVRAVTLAARAEAVVPDVLPRAMRQLRAS